MDRFDSLPYPPVYIKLLQEGRIKPGPFTRFALDELAALLARCQAAAMAAAPEPRKHDPK